MRRIFEAAVVRCQAERFTSLKHKQRQFRVSIFLNVNKFRLLIVYGLSFQNLTKED